MQVVLKVLSALTASMTVEYSNDLNVGPIHDCRNFVSWMNHIKNDGDSVFIVLSDQTYVSIRSERLHYPKGLIRSLAVLEVWQPIVLLLKRIRFDLVAQEHLVFDLHVLIVDHFLSCTIDT